jgi:cytochrome c oxidase assembly factor 5
LAQCLAESDCVFNGNKASDCLRPPLADTLSPECKALKFTYGQCKRNLIDMRKRFRGPVPVHYRKGDGSDMLYSGVKPKEAANDEDDGATAR